MNKEPTEESAEKTVSALDRRSFVKFIPAIGAAGLVAVSLPARAPAQVPAASPAPSPSPSPTPAQPTPLAQAYAEVAQVRFGKHIDEGQWERVKRDLEGNVRTADRLRESKLKNSDEPDFIFFA